MGFTACSLGQNYAKCVNYYYYKLKDPSESLTLDFQGLFALLLFCGTKQSADRRAT